MKKNPFKSITRKMIFVFCVFLSILMIGIALMNVMFFRSFKIRQNEKQMIKQGKIISGYLKEKEIDGKLLKLYQDEITQIVESYNLTVRIVNKKYNVIFGATNYRSQRNLKLPKIMVDLLKDKEKLINSNDYYMIQTSHDESGNPRIMYVKRLNDQHLLLISRTVKSIDEDIENSNLFLLISGGIVAVLGLFVIYRFSKSFTNPILRINEAAQRISRLDFSQQIEVTSEDELGELSLSMNLISDKLSESIQLLTDDVEQRKQLVRDLSHELKTPITAIKGYSEALKFGVVKTKEKRERYYEIIVQECDRMNSLIQEMMELSRMDTLADRLEINKFDLERVLFEIQEQYEDQMAEKNVEFNVNLSTPWVTGDRHILKRAIKNMVENAVRYVNQNGSIRIVGKVDENEYHLSIYNTGSNLPVEALNSVWDVFYKVDTSRKRELNTYGIGLSIVKSAVELHHGRVEAKNIKDGVVFQMILPCIDGSNILAPEAKKELKDDIE